MKRVFNGQTNTMTIEMNYEDYLKLFCAIEYEAGREEYTAYKKEFKDLFEKLNKSDYNSI